MVAPADEGVINQSEEENVDYGRNSGNDENMHRRSDDSGGSRDVQAFFSCAISLNAYTEHPVCQNLFSGMLASAGDNRPGFEHRCEIDASG